MIYIYNILIDIYNDNGFIYQEDTTFINIYPHNFGTPEYIKQIITDLMG